MKAKVTGLDISEREKAWSMIYLLLLWQNRHQTVAKSMYVLVKLKPLVKEEKVSMPMVTMRKEF
jgi:hypothetical protein